MRMTSLAVVLMLIGCPIGQCLAGQQSPTIKLEALTVTGKFDGAKDEDTGNVKRPAIDISGISCLARDGGKRTCLLVNDENKNAQFATFDDTAGELTVGETVTLIGDRPNPDTLGQAPEASCRKDDGFKDLDAEGIAHADHYFYVVGSHGCSRKKDKFRLSSFTLARIDSSAANQVTTTYRVSELLMKSKKVKTFFGKDLDSENGLNIEGIAATGDTLWVGLRAPVTNDGDAYLVSGSIAEIFQAGHDKAVTAVHAVGLKLDGRGIRDLAPLPDGRLMVLAGAAHEEDVPFKLYIVDPATGTTKELGTLEKVSQKVKGEDTVGKAEGLTVLEAAADKAQFVVVFDSLPNGAPHRGEVDLP